MNVSSEYDPLRKVYISEEVIQKIREGRRSQRSHRSQRLQRLQQGDLQEQDKDQENADDPPPDSYNENYNEELNSIKSQNSRYKILNKIIGTGAYSVVYAGVVEASVDLELVGSNVAIKKIKLKKISKSDSHFIESEEEICRDLIDHQCQNVVKIFDVINTKYDLYIVMEVLTGYTLASILIKPMKECYIKYYIAQIINGLAYLHSRSIIHCDIKPDNILISSDYKTIKICDFGFSYKIDTIDPIDKAKRICGSPIYMAPEMRKKYNDPSSDPNDYKIDIWSLGMICYEMIYGFHPFRGIRDGTSIDKAISLLKLETASYSSIKKRGLTFLKSMLEIDSDLRADVNDLVSDTWIIPAAKSKYTISMPITIQFDSPKSDCTETSFTDYRFDPDNPNGEIDYETVINKRFEKIAKNLKLSDLFYTTSKTITPLSCSCPPVNKCLDIYSNKKLDETKSCRENKYNFKKVSVETILFGYSNKK